LDGRDFVTDYEPAGRLTVKVIAETPTVYASFGSPGHFRCL
jgi:hypothetical protein